MEEKSEKTFSGISLSSFLKRKKKNQHELLYLIAEWNVNYLLEYSRYEKYERQARSPPLLLDPTIGKHSLLLYGHKIFFWLKYT